MKRTILIFLPILAVLLLGGLAYTKPDLEDKKIIKPFLRMLFSDNLRLGIIFSREELAEKSPEGGLRIERVVPGSPAEKAGLRKGDIILKIDGEKVKHPRDIREYLEDMDEPREIDLEILRDGKRMDLRVTPEKPAFCSILGGGKYIGVHLQELNPDLASYFQVDPNAGVLVVTVEKDSPAAKADIRSGDVITNINGEKVRTAQDIREAIGDTKEGESVEIAVIRHGTEKKIIVKPEDRGFSGHFPMLEKQLEYLESPEFQENLKKLEKEMEELKRELKDRIRKEDFQQLKEEIQRNFRKEMEKFRKELKERDKET